MVFGLVNIFSRLDFHYNSTTNVWIYLLAYFAYNEIYEIYFPLFTKKYPIDGNVTRADIIDSSKVQLAQISPPAISVPEK